LVLGVEVCKSLLKQNHVPGTQGLTFISYCGAEESLPLSLVIQRGSNSLSLTHFSPSSPAHRAGIRSMRVSSATAKMRADVSSGGSRIGRGADGGDEKSLAAAAVTASEEETATSASAAARLAATAPTATRRRRTAASASAAAPEKEKKNKEHAPILTFSFPGPLKKLFFRGAGGKRAEEAKKKEKKRTENGLAHYEELPDFLKDNDFVRSWYRRESTPRAAVESLWRLHNETGNIWSHALGEIERERVWFFFSLFFFLVFF